MQIDIRRIKGMSSGSLEVSTELPVPDLGRIVEVDQVLTPLQVNVKVTNTRTGLYVEGRLETKLSLVCTRCLTPFLYDVTADFTELFMQQTSAASNQSEEEIFFSEEAPSYKGDQLDVTELIYESLLLELPMKALCLDQCKGLCSECGQVQNLGACQCKIDKTDPRLASLADLFKKE